MKMRSWAWASLFVGLSISAGCTVTPSFDADVLDGGLARGFGEGCASTEDCASGLCLDVGVRSICTEVCSSDSDCPSASNWGCVAPEDLGGAHVCGCNGRATTEVCANGLDDDCNGEVDECRMCDGVPVAEDDPAHCGACGNRCHSDQECSGGMCRCPAGLTECGGVCVDTSASSDHCGACGQVCEAGSTCADGACTCADPLNQFCPGVGCVELSSSFVHCGSCGNRCPSGGACRDGTCACIDAGDTVCDGACVDLDTDAANCGSCGLACSATEQCVGGVCSCPSATPDRCGTECVDLRLDLDNCGACGVACAPGSRCLARSCSCFGGAGRVCDGTCYPPGDEANCGGCGLVCPAGQACDDAADACYCPGTGRPPCADGSCPNVFSDVSNCGACGNVCRVGESCVSGACTCPSGTTYCGSSCVSTTSDPMNCGGCGLACAPGQACSSGACVCPSGTTLCPGVGCVSTASDPRNCGACGTACAIGQTCSARRCVCPAGTPTVCGGACTSTSTDPNNCGSCGNVCPSGTSCSSGRCLCPGSGLGELYCASAGACVDTRHSTTHCGGCDRACPPGATCTGSGCACPTSTDLACGTSCIDPLTDEANCGSCGRVCSGSLVCLGGSCTCEPPVPGTSVRVTTADGASERVAAAWNGTDAALVVWRDDRTGVFQTHAQRVAADGTLLGPALVLSSASGLGTQHVSVVWTGSEWGVSWSQFVTADREDIYLTRLDASGAVIAGPLRIRASDWRANYRYLLFTSTLGYVAIRGPDTSVQSFGPLGTTPGMALTLPRPAFGFVNDCAVASLPSGEIGILSTGDSLSPGVYFQRLNADGSYTAASVTVRSTYADSPVLAHDGATWVGAWRETSGATSIVLAHGASLGARTVVVAGAVVGANTYRRPSLAVTGSTAMLTWQATGDTVWRIDGRRYRLPGSTPVALDPAASIYMPTTSVADLLHAVVAVPGGALLAWSDSRWGATEIYEQLVGLVPCAP